MRLIDADVLMWKLQSQLPQVKTIPTWILDAILDEPTIDAVPVVRCKDCVYRVIVRDPLMGTMDCYGCKVMRYNEDDWYCSFGERKDDDKSCGTCKHYDKGWDDIVCDGCTKAHSNWEREDDE